MTVFYRNLFATKNSAPYILDCLPVKRLTTTAALDLERCFEEPEIWETVKPFGENKAPGLMVSILVLQKSMAYYEK